MPCCLRHTSLFTRCGTTACVPFLSVDVNRDLFPINTILILLFSHFTCLLPNKSFQSRLFRLYCSIVFYCAHLHQLALLRIQERISVQGSFRTCWEWKRVLEEEKKEKRQYTRQIIKSHDWRENCRKRKSITFFKTGNCP